MDEQRRRALFCISALLRYPDEALQANLHDIRRDKRRRLPDLPMEVTHFMDYADGERITALQTMYVRTFDQRTGLSLHLTSPVCHDIPRQQHALTYLAQIYRDAGYNPLAGEPPDYLPLVLEFMASAPDWVCAYLCEEFAPVVEQLATLAGDVDTPYAELVRSAAHIMREHCPRYKKA